MDAFRHLAVSNMARVCRMKSKENCDKSSDFCKWEDGKCVSKADPNKI